MDYRCVYLGEDWWEMQGEVSLEPRLKELVEVEKMFAFLTSIFGHAGRTELWCYRAEQVCRVYFRGDRFDKSHAGDFGSVRVSFFMTTAVTTAFTSNFKTKFQ